MRLGQTAGPAPTLGHAPGAGASASAGRGTPPHRHLSAPRCCGAATKRAGSCREECGSEWGREVEQNSPAPCPPGPAPGLRAGLWGKGGRAPRLCSCLHALSLASPGRPGGPGPGCGGGAPPPVSKPCGQEVCRQVTAAEPMRGGGRRESQPPGPARMAGRPQAPPLGQGLARSPAQREAPGRCLWRGLLGREPGAWAGEGAGPLRLEGKVLAGAWGELGASCGDPRRGWGGGIQGGTHTPALLAPPSPELRAVTRLRKAGRRLTEPCPCL